jgi:hypothetical protein
VVPLAAAGEPPQVLRVGSLRVGDPPRLEGSCGNPGESDPGVVSARVGKRVFAAGPVLPRRRIKQRRIDRHPPLVPKVPRLLNHVLDPDRSNIEIARAIRSSVHAVMNATAAAGACGVGALAATPIAVPAYSASAWSRRLNWTSLPETSASRSLSSRNDAASDSMNTGPPSTT